MFLFLSYSFGIETINMFIHFVVPWKTIPDARPKWASVYPFLEAQKPHPMERHLPDGLYKGVPPRDFVL